MALIRPTTLLLATGMSAPALWHAVVAKDLSGTVAMLEDEFLATTTLLAIPKFPARSVQLRESWLPVVCVNVSVKDSAGVVGQDVGHRVGVGLLQVGVAKPIEPEFEQLPGRPDGHAE